MIDQGTILDRIDYNMEQTISHTEAGLEHLHKAEEHQKNALAMRCIFLLMFLIAVMLTALVLKHSDSKKK